jgi:hypothetical protein
MPGRMRIKIEAACDNVALLDSLRQVLARCAGIDAMVDESHSDSLVALLRSPIEPRWRRALHPAAAGASKRSANAELVAKPEAEVEFLARRSESAHAVVDFFKQFDRRSCTATVHRVAEARMISRRDRVPRSATTCL